MVVPQLFQQRGEKFLRALQGLQSTGYAEKSAKTRTARTRAHV